jgi:hypothetical protein
VFDVFMLWKLPISSMAFSLSNGAKTKQSHVVCSHLERPEHILLLASAALGTTKAIRWNDEVALRTRHSFFPKSYSYLYISTRYVHTM